MWPNLHPPGQSWLEPDTDSVAVTWPDWERVSPVPKQSSLPPILKCCQSSQRVITLGPDLRTAAPLQKWHLKAVPDCEHTLPFNVIFGAPRHLLKQGHLGTRHRIGKLWWGEGKGDWDTHPLHVWKGVSALWESTYYHGGLDRCQYGDVSKATTEPKSGIRLLPMHDFSWLWHYFHYMCLLSPFVKLVWIPCQSKATHGWLHTLPGPCEGV